jgi:cobaltochelatase CobS
MQLIPAITWHHEFSQFLELNFLPECKDWQEAADLLGIEYANQTPRDAIKAAADAHAEPAATVTAEIIPVEKPHPVAPAKQSKPATPAADGLAAIIAQHLAEHMPPPQAAEMDEARVIALIQEFSPVHVARTEITVNDRTHTVEGRQHAAFPRILRHLAAGIYPYLYGPAGTGKSHIAEQAAQALGKRFFSLSVCAQSTKSDLLGFMNAAGSYTGTLFRDAYENGGVFLLDEIDNGNPNVLAVLNGALANGHCAFPDGMVKRHADFQLVACANTFGTGATREYVGRNQLDAATLNRFVQTEVKYDEGLEAELWPEVAGKVQAIRHKLAGERVIISMRNIANAAALMRTGCTAAEAIDEAVIETIPETLRSRI